jgi:DNA-binding transcriptional regulator YiaG
MSRIEFSLALNMLGWNDEQAANILGLSTHTIANWNTGSRRVFQPAARLMRVLVRQGSAYARDLSNLLIEVARPIPYPPALIMAA